ncbi:SurA N-terminal domain-containing protein [Brevibacillus fluminis]|uniref:SurA N-terminal domain-containing protein n=1 Tax=Brevibacillus fluminis TaxID=511487 RepID=UPI003F8C404D
MKKFDLTILTISVLALALVILGVATSGGSGHSSATVATINGEKVTEQQLNDTMKEKYGEKTLTAMTSSILIEQEAKKTGTTVDEAQVQDQLKQLKAKLGSEDAYKTYLERRNYTEETLTTKLRELMLVQKLTAAYNKQHNTKLTPNDYVDELNKNAQIVISDPMLQKK